MNNVPEFIKIFLVAMTPVGELRASIPMGINFYDLPWFSVLLWSVMGNIFSAFLLLLFLESVSNFLSKHFRVFKKFFTWLFERTHRRHSKQFEIWGSIALVLFVAIPLPMTGAWTGSAAAFVFGIKFKKALPLIALGILIAGIIVVMLSLGAAQYLSLL